MKRLAVIAVLLLLVGAVIFAATRSGIDPEAAPPPSAADTTAATTPAEPTAAPSSPADSATPSSSSTTAASASTQEATTTTTVPRPRTTAEATPEDPVPPGEVIEFTGVWDVAIAGVDLDATEYVVGLNQINPDPEPGFQYVLIELVGTYLGERTAEPVFEWAVSDGVETYGPSIPGCGVLPDSIYDVVEVVPGESFSGSICVPVRSENIDNGLSLTLQLVGDEPKFFSLDEF